MKFREWRVWDFLPNACSTYPNTLPKIGLFENRLLAYFCSRCRLKETGSSAAGSLEETYLSILLPIALETSLSTSIMSANYASGLSPCDSKGVLGRPEIYDTPEEVDEKVKMLSQLIAESKHCVLLIGAGISTAAGIPDFRGPQGIWTLEKREKEEAEKRRKEEKAANNARIKKQKVENNNPKKEDVSSTANDVKKEDNGGCNPANELIVKTEATSDPPKEIDIKKEEDDKKKSKGVSLAEAKPTFTHLTIKALIEKGFVKFIISQNVDGLFVKTGIPRKYLSEVHGNFYLNECNVCLKRFLRNSPSPTMTLKVSNISCPSPKSRCRPCKGFLRDTILDWEDNLPESELFSAEEHCKKADLILCLGTTLQINPIGKMPFDCKKRRKPDNPLKIVIVNLQATDKDRFADVVIHYDVEEVCQSICKNLKIEPSEAQDFTNFPDGEVHPWI